MKNNIKFQNGKNNNNKETKFGKKRNKTKREKNDFIVGWVGISDSLFGSGGVTGDAYMCWLA